MQKCPEALLKRFSVHLAFDHILLMCLEKNLPQTHTHTHKKMRENHKPLLFFKSAACHIYCRVEKRMQEIQVTDHILTRNNYNYLYFSCSQSLLIILADSKLTIKQILYLQTCISRILHYFFPICASFLSQYPPNTQRVSLEHQRGLTQ